MSARASPHTRGVVAALARSTLVLLRAAGLGAPCAVSELAAWGVGISSCRRISPAVGARMRAWGQVVVARGWCRAGPPIQTDSEANAALACDLVASALAPLHCRALDALARACAHDALSWTAAALRLGATWEEAWGGHAPAGPRPCAMRSGLVDRGTAPDGMLARCATWERHLRDSSTRARKYFCVRLVGPLSVLPARGPPRHRAPPRPPSLTGIGG